MCHVVWVIWTLSTLMRAKSSDFTRDQNILVPWCHRRHRYILNGFLAIVAIFIETLNFVGNVVKQTVVKTVGKGLFRMVLRRLGNGRRHNRTEHEKWLQKKRLPGSAVKHTSWISIYFRRYLLVTVTLTEIFIWNCCYGLSGNHESLDEITVGSFMLFIAVLITVAFYLKRVVHIKMNVIDLLRRLFVLYLNTPRISWGRNYCPYQCMYQWEASQKELFSLK